MTPKPKNKKPKPRPKPKSKLRIAMERKAEGVRMTIERFTAIKREMNLKFDMETMANNIRKRMQAKATQKVTGKDGHGVQRGKRSKKHPKGAGI